MSECVVNIKEYMNDLGVKAQLAGREISRTEIRQEKLGVIEDCRSYRS